MRSIFSVNLKCEKCGSDLDGEIKPNSTGYESRVNLIIKPCKTCNKSSEELKEELKKYLTEFLK